MEVWETASAEETRDLGARLGRILRPATVILLKGELGAGKTTLAQGIAWGLGVGEYLTSPSFTLVKEYTGRYPLYHLDLYRLAGLDQAEAIGLWDYLEGDGVAVVEWAERVPEIKRWFSRGYLEVEMLPAGETGERRRLAFLARGRSCRAILRELVASC